MVEANHPYFLTPSDSPGMNLININFDGTTYGNWRRGVLISLSAKNKLGFINGTCKKPEDDAPLFEQWRRCNDMVLAWLLNSLSREIAESVIYSQTAEDLWNELEQRYGQTDGAKMFQLQRELNNISQGTNDVAGYFNRLKKIWDQTKVTNTFMICSCDCSCGANTHNVKMNEDQQLIQFLMGLNEDFGGIRGNILMMKPLPTTTQAYSIVLHKETQKGVHSGNQVNGTTDSTAFNTNSQRWNNDRGNNEYKGNNQTLNQYANIDTKRNNSFCSYCKKQGHVKKKCYKLVGYPQSFKFNKPKRGYGNGQVNASMTEDEKNGNNTPEGMTSQGFTSDQCEKLIQMLQTVQTRNLGTSGSEPNASANCVGHFSEDASGVW
ncbi:hypothetical protein KY290_022218 [Solanum tuberosum]|uniref:Retrotransposon Copia-like N-terminal domain-containing protein n=1 Tax=Solanum tuberosum TaxID=4113 RepID=A0ABQ7V6S3_SOLTU|nr:hypothetical protein KY289_021347 [Solanum tuberosum]KAH0758725.1 hypothetical protein KY290_022218 [Solanum tuberosum]